MTAPIIWAHQGKGTSLVHSLDPTGSRGSQPVYIVYSAGFIHCFTRLAIRITVWNGSQIRFIDSVGLNENINFVNKSKDQSVRSYLESHN